jgi:hypothetical protein
MDVIRDSFYLEVLFFVLSFGVFLLPSSSVPIWISFYDSEKFFEPCSGFPNCEYGDFLILIEVILSEEGE